MSSSLTRLFKSKLIVGYFFYLKQRQSNQHFQQCCQLTFYANVISLDEIKKKKKSIQSPVLLNLGMDMEP